MDKIQEILLRFRERFACYECDQEFFGPLNEGPGRRAFILHWTRNHIQKPFKCTCGAKFLRPNRLKQHQEASSKCQHRFYCAEHDLVFHRANALHNHLKRSHLGGSSNADVQCRLCEERFTSVVALEAHEQEHEWNRIRFCTVCSATFTNDEDLAGHRLAVHGGDRINCPHCGRDLSKKRLAEHVRLFHTKLELICNDCDGHFSKKEHFVRHWTNNHSRRPLSCPAQCGKLYLTHRQLSQHRLKSRNCQKYVCECCGVSSRTLRSFQKHQRQHLGLIDGFMVDCRQCGERFGSLVDLDAHESTHEAQRKFRCQICAEEFPNRWVLGHHRKKHDDDRVRCSVMGCKKTFANTANLRLHRDIAHIAEAEKTIICGECGAKFAFRSTLRDHLLKHRQREIMKDRSKWPCCERCGRQVRHLAKHIKVHEKKR